MSRPTYMQIDLAALRHNLERVHELAPGRSVIAMVKANAYGHGIARVAQGLPSVQALGVASLEEGIMLRVSGVSHPIVLMEGVFHADELSEAAKHDFILVVHHLLHVDMLEKTGLTHAFKVWIKVNTGMNRLGIDPKNAEQVYRRLTSAASVKKVVGWMTHFAEADDIESSATKNQIDSFKSLVANFAGKHSLANSAGILAWPQALGDYVRPGLMLYGASPLPDTTGLDHQLIPVMTLSSRLIAVTHVKRGGKVGYGGTWTADQDMTIGVVGVGYGDGYPQFAKSGTPVLVDGVMCRLAGRVSMDMLTVDLRNRPHAKIGDPVVLWGKGLPVELVAKNNHTSAYEILTRMTPRPKIRVTN